MQLAKAMALELAPTGITVNLIAPGTIETDLNRGFLADPGNRQAKLALIPMQRIGRPEDVAGAAVFLASEAAAYVTGTTVVVDGGLTLE
jgi:NAD(P)-dependent dehydrogenase (short-subunit alcohol dehydrogenase family)